MARAHAFLLLAAAAGWRAPHRSRSPRRVVRRDADADISIEEALAGADAYEGAGIVDPYYQHPDTLPQLHEWTAETFAADYEAGGHAPWPVLEEAFVFLRRRPAGAPKLRTHDHLFWARKSELKRAGDTYVVASQLLYDDDGDVEGSLVAVAAPDEAAARAFIDRDPGASAFGEAEGYHWTIAQDPYLMLDVWPEGHVPYATLRLDDAAGTRNRAGARDAHLSFLRKTRRTIRAGPLRPLDGQGAPGDRAPCGSLVYSFQESREALDAWAAADPYVAAGVFAAPPAVASSYVDLDVTGRQQTRPPPLNELPDPLLFDLVDAGLVELPVRVVDRIDRDPETGKFMRYNITTQDPRLESNTDIDDELMAAMAAMPKAVRAKRKRDKKNKEKELEEELEEFGPAAEDYENEFDG